jgi:predicted nucleic acid-binding protein
MDIILDTNIILTDFFLKSKSFKVLFDYLAKTNSDLLIPEIVFKETIHKYEEKLISELSNYDNTVNKLNSLLDDTVFKKVNIDISKKVSKYSNFLKNVKKPSYDSSKEIIVKYKDSFLEETIRRAIYRLKPCSNKGQEFRDTILWLTIIDYLKSIYKDDRKIIFISNNFKEFADSETKNKNLHPDLFKEVNELRACFEFLK